MKRWGRVALDGLIMCREEWLIYEWEGVSRLKLRERRDVKKDLK